MIKTIDINLQPNEAADPEFLNQFCSKKLHVAPKRIQGISILRRSIDARKVPILINLRVAVFIDEAAAPIAIAAQNYQDVHDAPEVIVVGAGPAGIFASLRLLELGLKPVLLERGKKIHERKRDLSQLNRSGVINPESNYCFGEGGAGTFSDGKLYTRSKKRGDIYRVLETFVLHGADESILVDAHPHIGTDKLPAIITNMRECIEKHGGLVFFETKVVKLLQDEKEVLGVQLEDGSSRMGPVILATGHSARDVYQMLHKDQISLEAKSFAMGVRVEHPQELIDQIQYHNPQGRGAYLPPATYRLVTQADGRGVYSFCMCPGGIIVPASSDNDSVVVNGMSASSRGSQWANSGMVVEIHPEDLPKDYQQNHGLLAGLKFQEDFEKKCALEGGGQQKAPAQSLKDFCEGVSSSQLASSSYVPGMKISDLHLWMPPLITKRLQMGFKQFNRQAKGFITNRANILGVESRTSSPLRIPRDPLSLAHVDFAKLYPCGEGAGYAGGIISSAVDGIRCAEQCAQLEACALK